MNITKFIMANEELSHLPFIIVYQTIITLQKLGMLKETIDVGEI